jgi:hypothetical protein
MKERKRCQQLARSRRPLLTLEVSKPARGSSRR